MRFALAAALALLASPPRLLGPPDEKPPRGALPPVSPGDSAPFFFAPVHNAKAAGLEQFNLADLVGRRAARRSPVKAVLLSFFSPSAKACRKELPVLQALYTEYKSSGLEVVSLATDPARLLQLHPVTYPVVEDREGAIAHRYLGPTPRYPAFVIIANGGTITSVQQGYRADPSLLLRSESTSALH
jgi:hypothetical protein